MLSKSGFAHDRCFAFAAQDGEGEWKFISQRTKPQMAMISQELWVPHDGCDPNLPYVKVGGCVVVSFPDPDKWSMTKHIKAMFEIWTIFVKPQVRFVIPLLHADSGETIELKLKNFRIHNQTASGLDLGALHSVVAYQSKLQRFLNLPPGSNVTILRSTPRTLVRTERNLAPLSNIGTPALHGYTDQQPVHLINISSVHEVSELLPPENQPLDAFRFRANIYLAGAPAFSEENWKQFRILP